MNWFLPGLALVIAACALLNFRRAPDFTWAWILALAASEYGHWLALLPLGLGFVAAWTLSGPAQWVTVALCLWSVVGFLRPAFQARSLGNKLGRGAFSFLRLYFRSAPRRAAVTTRTFAHHDGQELKLDFYAPSETAKRPAPCLIAVHGGGWDQGERDQIPEWNHRLAARGFAVATIDYRLAPKSRWPAQREDTLAAITWLKAHADELGIDPHQLVLLGRSAGGQIATAAGYGANDPDIVGVIAFYAPYDMPFAWTVCREDDALNSTKLMRQLLGGPPGGELDDVYVTASAQLQAKASSPPTLLIHGEPDTLVWHRHSVRLTTRLRELGVKCTFLELPWATHAFDFNADGPGGQLTDFAIRRFLADVTH